MNRRPNALDYPPYVAAVTQERLVRDAAFLGINESVSGFEVVPLTLRRFLALRIARNPLLFQQTPSPDELTAFLWYLSPQSSPHDTTGRRSFKRRCRKLFYPPRYLALLNTRRSRARFERKRQARLEVAAKIIDAAKEYVAEALQDQPPITVSRIGVYEPEYYSDAAAFCALFARDFGWSQEAVLDLPMKCIFQYLNERAAFNGSTRPPCNPSDSIKARFYRDLNCQLRANRQPKGKV